MNPPVNPQSAAPAQPFRLFLELIVVLGLPILSIFIGSALAIAAYTHGFTELAAHPPAASAAAHQR